MHAVGNKLYRTRAHHKRALSTPQIKSRVAGSLFTRAKPQLELVLIDVAAGYGTAGDKDVATWPQLTMRLRHSWSL